mmetsp:Transcript_32302/g.111190  ORF Transcript_32302/g.111190 Transcript_32302/m.111190 type:complete len:333 (-) Transcript_32302:1472-2470(-)
MRHAHQAFAEDFGDVAPRALADVQDVVVGVDVLWRRRRVTRRPRRLGQKPRVAHALRRRRLGHVTEHGLGAAREARILVCFAVAVRRRDPVEEQLRAEQLGPRLLRRVLRRALKRELRLRLGVLLTPLARFALGAKGRRRHDALLGDGHGPPDVVRGGAALRLERLLVRAPIRQRGGELRALGVDGRMPAAAARRASERERRASVVGARERCFVETVARVRCKQLVKVATELLRAPRLEFRIRFSFLLPQRPVASRGGAKFLAREASQCLDVRLDVRAAPPRLVRPLRRDGRRRLARKARVVVVVDVVLSRRAVDASAPCEGELGLGSELGS